MKTKLTLFALLLPLSSGFAAGKPASVPTEAVDASEKQTPATILAAQLKDITSTEGLSRAEQAKSVAKAVRLAVSASIDGVKKSSERLAIAAELAAAATKATPQFATTITQAITSLPVFAGLDGAAEQIQQAVSASLEDSSSGETQIANPAVNPARAPVNSQFGGPNQGEVVVSPSS